MRVIGQKVRLPVATKPRAIRAIAPVKASRPVAPAQAKAAGAMSMDDVNLDTMHQLPGKPGHFNYG